MTLFEFLIIIVVAALCGMLGRAIVGYSHGGCLVSIALGFIGALVGRWLGSVFRLPDVFVLQVGGHNFPVVWSIIGAALFVAVLSLLSRRVPS